MTATEVCRTLQRLACAAAMATFSIGPHSLGAPYTELEVDGSAANNTLFTAEILDASIFTPNSDPDVFGMLPTATVSGRGGAADVDFYSFTGGAGTAYFDVDNDPFSFDAYLALFDADGTLLGDSDDSFPPDPGSASDLDAFLGTFDLPAAGTYYIAVAQHPNFATATFTGTDFSELFRPDGGFGGFSFAGATFGDSTFDSSGPQVGLPYTLHVSVPEPCAALFILIGAGALSAARRRRPVQAP